MYQALYRKWRPRTFDDVVGQSHITDTLKQQVAGDRLSHAYLFTGTRGTGKTTCLINNDITSTSSKNKKAKELQVPILTEEEFLRTYNIPYEE